MRCLALFMDAWDMNWGNGDGVGESGFAMSRDEG